MHGAKIPRSDSFDFVDYQSSDETRDDATIIMRSQQPALEPFAPSQHTVRVELYNDDDKFPSLDITGPAPCYDQERPVFVGVAPFKGGLVPCKIIPDFMPNPVRLSHDGQEWTINKNEPFFVLPLDASTMEWVHTIDGKIPGGRRPVQGGFEANGEPLYHAVALIDGVRVPGKTGEHLDAGGHVPYGGVEETRKHYQILCWRN